MWSLLLVSGYLRVVDTTFVEGTNWNYGQEHRGNGWDEKEKQAAV